MSAPEVRAYGAWPSPLDAASVVAGAIGFGDIALDGDAVYWIENRPLEGGRAALVRYADGRTDTVTPSPFNVRSAVHEYGGGAYCVDNGTVFFSHLGDHALYRQPPGAPPQRITADAGGRHRYAGLIYDPSRQRLLCVRETHADGGGEPSNCIVAVGMDGGQQVLVEGADFYASLTLDAAGGRLAWLCWHHPQMPWDGTELWQARLSDDGALVDLQQLAGGPEESVFQPQWGPCAGAGKADRAPPGADDALYYVSDRSGWWNLYRRDSAGRVEPLAPCEAEFGLPQWVFNMSTYGFSDDGDVICVARSGGRCRLYRLTPGAALAPLDVPYSDIDGLRVGAGRAVFQGGSPRQPAAIIALPLDGGAPVALRHAGDPQIDPALLSQPEAIRFPSGNADGHAQAYAHAFFYPPCNPAASAPPGTLPPLLVKGHGGPTSATSTTLNLNVQYWTSRGFAVVDVNYRGSTGYGRAYRRALYGRWGIVDVEDCIAAARWLIDAGRVDPQRCAIRGSSAGGYTTLAALTFHDLFCAGASYYGISDLEVLAQDTHKFESRYMDQLIGPYPQQRERYIERSPLYHSDRLSAPVIFFQGLLDKVVPPNQAELMVAALRKKCIPVAYVTYADERHGFRQAANLRHALEAERYFYGRLFGFIADDASAPVTIEHFPSAG